MTGIPPEVARYFAAGRKKIIAVKPNEDFTLTLDFDNGERRLYDCKPLIEKGTVFEALMDYATFRRVYLDEASAVSWDIDPNVDSREAWNNKLDICPDCCYIESTPAGMAS